MEVDEFYDKHYSNFQSKGFQKLYIRLAHEKLEQGSRVEFGERILEIGGGRGEHISFVKNKFLSYLVTDIRALPKGVTLPPGVKFATVDAHKLPFEDHSFDRIIITCLLHHVESPEKVLREVKRVWKPTSNISIQLPCDPHFLYVVSKKLFVNRKWKNQGISSPMYLHWKEHRNHYLGLSEIINEVFKDYSIKKSLWPLRFIPLPVVNMFATYQIEV